MIALAALAASLTPAFGQQDRPEIMPGERRPAQKKQTGPRALAVLQLGTNGKASLVPIAILIDGKFWDASSYKANPVPMALEPGTVYEAERTGNALGLFTVGTALHSNAANASIPWLGTGAWQPSGTTQDKPIRKAEPAPLGIAEADAPPRLTRDPNAVHAPPSSGSPSSSTPPVAPSSSAPPRSADSDEPPRLSKGTPSPPPDQPTGSSGGQAPSGSTPPSGSGPSTGGAGSPSASPAGAPSGNSPPADSKPDSTPSAPAKPADAKAGGAKAEDRAPIAVSDSGAGEGNRPRLRRGKPAQSFADEDIPGYSRPGEKASATTGKVSDMVASLHPDVQLIPAISDATSNLLRPFAFDWVKGEEDDRRKQMTQLAKDQLVAYLAARAKASSGGKTDHAPAARHAAGPEPILESVGMAAYDLWRSNQPVMIFTATAHLPPPAAGSAHSDYDSGLEYSIVIVAYPDIYSNLRKLYVGVTDKFHLDITPRLELVDAVDADGDGVGELLFRETSDAGSGWVLYRATGDKLYKMFDSLIPEG
jgi:hypothetical protein